ncbi:MAG: hypothetical protein HY456_01485 [Parcubacteria group bacterium]|nr:hypothetical protein [Parcubacteria group bacterium]
MNKATVFVNAQSSIMVSAVLNTLRARHFNAKLLGGPYDIVVEVEAPTAEELQDLVSREIVSLPGVLKAVPQFHVA